MSGFYVALIIMGLTIPTLTMVLCFKPNPWLIGALVAVFIGSVWYMDEYHSEYTRVYQVGP